MDTRRPTILQLAALLLLVLAAPLLDTPLADADGRGGGEPDPVLDVGEVSPWVEPDGVFRVIFEPSFEVPVGARLSYTIRQRLSAGRSGTLRESARDVLAGDERGRALQSTVEQEVTVLGDPTAGLMLDVPIRSSSGDTSRRLIPSAGIHPVDLSLSSADGDELWTSTVYLNRLPSVPPTGRDDLPAATSVQLVAGMDSVPTLSPDGSLDLTADDRVAITALQLLLTEARDLPLTVALRPNTLVGLQRGNEPADRAFLELAGTAAWQLARQTYVRVQAAGLAATDTDELGRQVAAGDGVLLGLRGAAVGSATAPAPGTTWMLDNTVDTRAAATLAGLGVTHLLISEEQLQLSDTVPDAWEYSRNLAVEGVEGLTASAYDTELTRLLVEPGVEPGLRAHRTLTLMMAEWFDAIDDGTEVFPGVASAILVLPGTDITALQAVVEPLQTGGPLQLATPTDATVRDGEPVTARLGRAESASFDDVVRRTTAVGRRIDGYRSMTSPGDPQAALWDLVNDQAPYVFPDDTERRNIWEGVGAQLDASVALIEGPPSRTIVLTSRSGTIPLRLRNGLDVAVRLRLHTRSPRLEFPDGETREVVLAPGENRIDIPVDVQAPGSSLLRIEMSSPDGQLDLPDAEVTVRSSSISGVGAALSVLSLGVLAIWWIRTHRRRRRTDADKPLPPGTAPADTTTPSDADSPSNPAGVPVSTPEVVADAAGTGPPGSASPGSDGTDSTVGGGGPAADR